MSRSDGVALCAESPTPVSERHTIAVNNALSIEGWRGVGGVQETSHVLCGATLSFKFWTYSVEQGEVGGCVLRSAGGLGPRTLGLAMTGANGMFGMNGGGAWPRGGGGGAPGKGNGGCIIVDVLFGGCTVSR